VALSLLHAELMMWGAHALVHVRRKVSLARMRAMLVRLSGNKTEILFYVFVCVLVVHDASMT
jgi:hypothetical protein